MTLEEAQKVANIISQADGGCSHCVNALLDEARKDFPEFIWSDYDYYGDQTITVIERRDTTCQKLSA